MAPSSTRNKKKRNLEETRKTILNIAFKEVFARGFQGVSIDDIVKKTKLTKGAFYHHFPTKLDLGYTLVEEVITPMIIDRWITPLAAYKNPLHGILKQLQKNIGEASTESLNYGCPLNNLVQEMSTVDEGFKLRLQSGLALWVSETEKHLKRAKGEGLLKKEISPKQVAQFIVMAHEGFYGMLKGVGSSEPKLFEALFLNLKQYFETITNAV